MKWTLWTRLHCTAMMPPTLVCQVANCELADKLRKFALDIHPESVCATNNARGFAVIVFPSPERPDSWSAVQPFVCRTATGIHAATIMSPNRKRLLARTPYGNLRQVLAVHAGADMVHCLSRTKQRSDELCAVGCLIVWRLLAEHREASILLHGLACLTTLYCTLETQEPYKSQPAAV